MKTVSLILTIVTTFASSSEVGNVDTFVPLVNSGALIVENKVTVTSQSASLKALQSKLFAREESGNECQAFATEHPEICSAPANVPPSVLREAVMECVNHPEFPKSCMLRLDARVTTSGCLDYDNFQYTQIRWFLNDNLTDFSSEAFSIDFVGANESCAVGDIPSEDTQQSGSAVWETQLLSGNSCNATQVVDATLAAATGNIGSTVSIVPQNNYEYNLNGQTNVISLRIPSYNDGICRISSAQGTFSLFTILKPSDYVADAASSVQSKLIRASMMSVVVVFSILVLLM